MLISLVSSFDVAVSMYTYIYVYILCIDVYVHLDISDWCRQHIKCQGLCPICVRSGHIWEGQSLWALFFIRPESAQLLQLPHPVRLYSLPRSIRLDLAA